VLAWLVGHAVVVAMVALVMATTGAMLSGRRAPGSNLGWLLALVAMPYLTVPAFWMLAARKFDAGVARLRFAPAPGPGLAPAAPAPAEPAPFARLGAPPPREGCAVGLLTDGQAAWAALMEVVASAERSLEATFFIVDDDPSGRAFVEALTERARAGVAVRLLIDRIGGLSRPRRALAGFRAAGGELRFAGPLLGGVRRTGPNLRNHRKMVIADEARVLSGGVNVGVEYMGPGPDGPDRWIDLATRVEGPVVADYLAVCRADWAAAAGAPPPPVPPPGAAAGAAPAQLVPSGPDVAQDALAEGLISMIHRADRRIWIASPYLVPPEAMIAALGLAARRDVDVRLIGPARSNHRLADLARAPILRELAGEGVRVLLHPRMIHAKAGVIDEAGFVGSANLDARSLLYNHESVLFLTGAAEVAALAGWARALMAGCAEGPAPSARPRRLAENAIRLATPLL
jgi:cardiolipin synthase